MPELPEMETYKRLLNQQLAGRVISDVEVNREKSLNVPVAEFMQGLKGNQIVEIRRRAKYLIFKLGSGRSLLLHLMLAGWLYLGSGKDSPERTKQIILSFGDSSLFFIGLRLGYLHLLDDFALQRVLGVLGPEPLQNDFTFSVFQKSLLRKKGKLKTTLTDQKVISGIGNYYSDEICFESKVMPAVTIDSLDEDKMLSIYSSIGKVLQNAISFGGYMDNPLFSADNLTGGYNNHRLVYDREGEKCIRCGGTIVKVELSSRKCFYCPDCQSG